MVTLVRVFNHEWIQNFVKCFFCIYWDNSEIFSFILLIWYIVLTDLQILNCLKYSLMIVYTSVIKSCILDSIIGTHKGGLQINKPVNLRKQKTTKIMVLAYKQIDQWNRLECPDINIFIQTLVLFCFFNKVAKTTLQRRSLFNKCTRIIGYVCLKNNLDPYLEPYTKTNSKWTQTYMNNLKLQNLQNKCRRKFLCPWVSQRFLRCAPEALSINFKIDKMDFTKI